MFYWYSKLAGKYYVLNQYQVIQGYKSEGAVLIDYPTAHLCPCVELDK